MKICEKELWKIIDQSPRGILIADKNLKIRYINEQYSKITGYEAEDIIDKDVSFLQYGQEYFYMWNNIYKKERDRIEIFHKKENGENIYSLCTISNVKDEMDNVLFYLEAQEDITSIKNIEIELKEKNDQLKKALEEAENMQFQMINQDKMASIGYLAAGVAHEINNPLGFISSNFESLTKYIKTLKEIMDKEHELQLLIMGNQCEKAMEKAKNIEEIKKDKNLDFIYEDLNILMEESNEGVERIREIVKSLRVFSHEAADNKFENYDLNDGIKETLVIAKNEIKYYAKVNLNLQDIPLIEAVSGHINQVILNIIVNAVYAIKEKEMKSIGNIDISTYSDGNFVCCEIKDDGIGMKEETLSKIFEAFFTTKPAGKGTGLGLSISYDIIKNKHKGDIEVESVYGEGTKFIIKLPITQ